MAWDPSNSYEVFVRLEFSGLLVDKTSQKLVFLVNRGGAELFLALSVSHKR